MPWLEGITLYEFISTNVVLSLIKRMQLIRSILQLLDTLHSAGYIHGDMNFNNILVNERTLTCELIDFGALRKPGGKCYGIASDDFIPNKFRFTRNTDLERMYTYTDEVYSAGVIANMIMKGIACDPVSVENSTKNELIVLITNMSSQSEPERPSVKDCISALDGHIADVQDAENNADSTLNQPLLPEKRNNRRPQNKCWPCSIL